MNNIVLQYLGKRLAHIFFGIISHQELFIERTAHEILWGYDEPLYGMLALLGLTDSSQFAAVVRNIDVMLCYCVPPFFY